MAERWHCKLWIEVMGIVETMFSCINRMFGEYVNSIKFENRVKEMMLNAYSITSQ